MILFFLLPLISVAGGCRGTATLHMIPLTVKQIDARNPLIIRLDADQCYFWIDEQDRVHVALTNSRSAAFDGPTWFAASLVLNDPPAHVARNYPANRRTARGIVVQNERFARFASTRGIVALWLDDPDHARGRLRIIARYQRFHVLLGWHAPRQLLITGDFEAVRDRARGEAVESQTEQGGMERSEDEFIRPEPVPVQGPPIEPA
jgi:hypothetical protein